MEYIVFIVAIFAAFVAKAIYDKKANIKKLIQRLERQWGEVPEQEYTVEALESLTYYYRSTKDASKDIDDITWNDIDMEEIFMLMNNTGSAMGEEYLYSLLRKLQFNEEELLERNRLIEFFQNNKDQRQKIQVALNGMGKIRNISVYEYINALNNLKERNSLPNYIMAAGLLASIALFAVNPAMAGILTIGFFINNILQYYRIKGQIDAYFTVCAYVIRLLNGIKVISKLEIPEIKKYTDQLAIAGKKFEQFKRGSKIVTSKNPVGDMSDMVLDYLRMLFHIDLIKFNSMLKCFKKNKDALNLMYENIGILDSMIAAASFRTMLDYYSVPVLKKGGTPFMEATELYHPMIEEPVTNSIQVDKCVLITGSNASGKSTFIKTLAINAILSQTIYTSASRTYSGSYFQIASSMALQDNIFSKESYYIVEIKSLKRILDLINDDTPTLCFVDEVLRGTNTLERIAASSQILMNFAKSNAVCFAATHDVELTHILENYYTNYHFQEQIVEDNVLFDYKLLKGRAISKNAIKLLGVMGYSKEIIESASESANGFLQEGTWKILQ
jgi:DNA mismatch repair ATPase MutS